MEQEIFQRKQFTFYESFYNCIRKTLRKKSEKLAAYEALIQYALYGNITDFENLPDAVSGLLEAIYPVLNTARRNAINARQPEKAKRTDSAACEVGTKFNTGKKEIENKIENEIKIETENKEAALDFERFWFSYPKKIGKEEAYKEFLQAGQSVDVLLKAIEQQRSSPQWTKEHGQYIPSPAKWLKNKRWNDQVPHIQNPYGLSDLDLQAINRIMATSAGS